MTVHGADKPDWLTDLEARAEEAEAEVLALREHTTNVLSRLRAALAHERAMTWLYMHRLYMHNCGCGVLVRTCEYHSARDAVDAELSFLASPQQEK